MASAGAAPTVSVVPTGGTSAAVSEVSAFSGLVTRTWSISHNARLYVVQLYHNTITGDRSLSVDGSEQAGTAGTSTIFSGPATLVFTLGDKAGSVNVANRGATFEYACTFGDVLVPEDNSIISSASGDDAVNRLKLSVDEYAMACDETGKSVVWFQLRTVRENDERTTVVHRRFNNFVAINETLRSAYKGSQLLSSFPELPARGYFWEDQTKPEFLEKRRFGLSDWLQKIALIPRMRLNPDFLTFLGIVDRSREVSVIFPPESALGLALRDAGNGFTEVSAVKPLPDGSPSPAQASRVVLPGYQVSKVNGDNVLGENHSVVLARIKSAPRPLIIHFIGTFPDAAPPTHAASAADATATAPAFAAVPVAVDEPVTDLIGGGVSYVGTGATPKPAAASARSGLAATAVSVPVAHEGSIRAGGTGEGGAADGTDAASGIVGGVAGLL